MAPNIELSRILLEAEQARPLRISWNLDIFSLILNSDSIRAPCKMRHERNFAIVFWLKEQQYSIVKRKAILDKYVEVGECFGTTAKAKVGTPPELSVRELFGRLSSSIEFYLDNKSSLAKELDGLIETLDLEQGRSKRKPKRKQLILNQSQPAQCYFHIKEGPISTRINNDSSGRFEIFNEIN